MPSTGGSAYAGRPIAELAELANEYDFDQSVHLRYWIRSANAILRQAKVYDLEQTYDEAYILYLRYAQLVLNTLHTHPQARKLPERQQLAVLSKKLSPILVRLQELKVIIEELNLEFGKRQQALTARRDQLALQRSIAKGRQLENENRILENTSIDMSGLGADEHPELLRIQDQSNLGSRFEDLDNDGVQHEYRYPSLPSHDQQAPVGLEAAVLKQELPQTTSAHAQHQVSKQGIEHKASALTEGGTALRTVFLPTELRSSFLQVALTNTKRKLETCGILCGLLNRNAFFITHLVIPEQESTSDTCATKDEEGLFNFLDENDLFTLGWIHTHPTQTCFLSSVDLHTQNSYQLMLSEAIAIVCAPMHEPSWGVFRLTDPPGIKVITNCRRPGTFHPHPEKNIYTEAQMPPGHVSVRDGLPFKVVDLRKSSA
ncbi:hypothetical protein V1514DRAFT_337824 [Lipomyces japonicus]|uniref:uncharacterized protein n=1 Tax=Lipomyces japonicus TaxID=56871 RepID=UPI0034CDACAC